MLFGQLVCYGCHRILTYPLGAVTCRCRLCNTVNAAQNLQVTCGACGQELHAPINTLALLCPCCGTVTDIPEELLPPLPSCVDLGGGEDEMETAIYVSHPTLPPQPPPPPQQQQQQSRVTAEDGANGAAASSNGGKRRSSTHTKADGQPTSSSRRRRSSREEKEKEKEATAAAAGNRLEAGTGAAHDAGRRRSTERKRNDSAGPLAPDLSQEMVVPDVSATSRTARPVAASRLAPTVMIATRIL
ncbi:LSD1 zinc finger containing protein [Novymonas esmeraldas]|uniref:LSD1 zinc finger containing protein n=1 Tax=Novymonas esmeraldas TaxID=1808958 RepID=A0AAW0EVE7_9TRYP